MVVPPVFRSKYAVEICLRYFCSVACYLTKNNKCIRNQTKQKHACNTALLLLRLFRNKKFHPQTVSHTSFKSPAYTQVLCFSSVFYCSVTALAYTQSTVSNEWSVKINEGEPVTVRSKHGVSVRCLPKHPALYISKNIWKSTKILRCGIAKMKIGRPPAQLNSRSCMRTAQRRYMFTHSWHQH
jgi:hypothetical protein